MNRREADSKIERVIDNKIIKTESLIVKLKVHILIYGVSHDVCMFKK